MNKLFSALFVLVYLQHFDCIINQQRCFMRNNDEVCFSYFSLYPTMLVWQKADDYCNASYPGGEGHLASVHNENESLILFDLTKPPIEDDHCWFGLYDSKMLVQQSSLLEDQWYWSYSDGSPVDYSHWRSGYHKEPTWSRFNREGCGLVIAGSSSRSLWNNQRCNRPHGCLVCQYFSKSYSERHRNDHKDKYATLETAFQQLQIRNKIDVAVLSSLVIVLLVLVLMAFVRSRGYKFNPASLATSIVNYWNRMRTKQANSSNNDDSNERIIDG